MRIRRRHSRGPLTTAAIVMAWGMGAASAARAQSAAEIVAQGNGRGAPACISCHGPRMLGNPVLGYPRLAGLNAEYLESQLDALARGTRQNAVMLPVASSLSSSERQALAVYLSALPVPATLPEPPDSAPGAHPTATQLQLGQRLATRGRWAGGLPGCDQCHGPGGSGVGAAFPPLAGQSALYLTNQMTAWRRGTRPPGPLGLMAVVVQRMSDAEIAAVAAYYRTLPPPPAESREAHR